MFSGRNPGTCGGRTGMSSERKCSPHGSVVAPALAPVADAVAPAALPASSGRSIRIKSALGLGCQPDGYVSRTPPVELTKVRCAASTPRTGGACAVAVTGAVVATGAVAGKGFGGSV